MFCPTYKDHFYFGFNGKPWREYEKVDDEFFVHYGRPTFSPGSWRTANLAAADLIASAARRINKAPVICFSGGVDSQVVALAFKDAGFKPELWHFNTGHPYETLVVREFAKTHDFPLVESKVNVAEFFQSGMNLKYQTVPIIHGTYELHCRLMDLVCSQQMIPIYGEGSLTRRIGKTWTVGEGHTYKTTSRYARSKGYDAVPTFFNYLPDQTYAYCKSNFIQLLCENRLTNFAVMNRKDLAPLSSRFNGDTVHHVKMQLIKDEYPEAILIRKQVGHEHLAGEPWYESNLSPERRKQWGDYMKKHYLRFDMFEPAKLIDYFEGRAELADARVARQPSVFWNYPE